jgi:hypothetical protein
MKETMKSEKEKMLAGELYDASDRMLTQERLANTRPDPSIECNPLW